MPGIFIGFRICDSPMRLVLRVDFFTFLSHWKSACSEAYSGNVKEAPANKGMTTPAACFAAKTKERNLPGEKSSSVMVHCTAHIFLRPEEIERAGNN